MKYCMYSIVGEDKTGPLLSQVKRASESLLWGLLDKGLPQSENPERDLYTSLNGLRFTICPCSPGLTVQGQRERHQAKEPQTTSGKGLGHCLEANRFPETTL